MSKKVPSEEPVGASIVTVGNPADVMAGPADNVKQYAAHRLENHEFPEDVELRKYNERLHGVFGAP